VTELGLVTLLSDFGLLDPYVAEMKAVILSVSRELKIVDITHQVEKFNIRMGSLLLASATPYFPKGTVHCAVVDPGVGGERRPIVIETEGSVFVGPDNGLLIPAAERAGITQVYELTNHSLMRPEISATFHGRDVFAPAAAQLACGTPPRECGPPIYDYAKPSFVLPAFNGKSATGEVLHVDDFGNIVTNMPQEFLAKLGMNLREILQVNIGKRRFLARYVRAYSDLAGVEVGILTGSHGFLEIARRNMNASKKLKIKAGATVEIAVRARR
jgi:S-adenosylmethionine hydrolase